MQLLRTMPHLVARDILARTRNLYESSKNKKMVEDMYRHVKDLNFCDKLVRSVTITHQSQETTCVAKQSFAMLPSASTLKEVIIDDDDAEW
jgi:hypothetical protein